MQSGVMRLNGRGNSTPRDLREASARAGRTYPVSPDAIAHYRKVLASQPEPRATAAASNKPASMRFETKKQRMATLDLKRPLLELSLYPTAVVKAAAAELALINSGKRKIPVLADIFTDEVVRIWHELKEMHDDITNNWLAQNNGLIKVSAPTIQRYLSQVSATPTAHPLPRQRPRLSLKKKRPLTRRQSSTQSRPTCQPFCDGMTTTRQQCHARPLLSCWPCSIVMMSPCAAH